MVKQGSSDLASLAWICHAEQLYIDAALVLDASTRVAAASRSCLIDVLHFTFVVDAARSGLMDLRFAPRAVRFFAF